MPVVLVTGDRAVCNEARELLGDGLTTVEVKEGLGRFSARMKTPHEARELIEAGAKKALVGPVGRRAVRPRQAVRDRDRVHHAGSGCEEYANRKGVEVTGRSSLVVRGDDWWSAWSSFFF